LTEAKPPPPVPPRLASDAAFTSELTPAPPTRVVLHTIAAHVLARRRFAVSGRFGLRAGPSGIVTPTFGDAPETIRMSGVTLIREVGATSTSMPMNGSTLRHRATFVEADLDEPFSCGADTPLLGPVDMPLELAPPAVTEIADWFTLAWRVLDDVVLSLLEQCEVATIQLWPEHFDAATTVKLPRGEPVNLGFSPGDAFESEPYLYVGPWGGERPGDPSFWNAPFGAVLRRSELDDSLDRAEPCHRFLAHGLDLVASS
jgi:hypothetical protein